jgi:hypothetical protein
VRDVEQAGMLAGMKVLLHHAGRVGEGHVTSRRIRRNFAPCRDMQVFEGEVFQFAVGQ